MKQSSLESYRYCCAPYDCSDELGSRYNGSMVYSREDPEMVSSGVLSTLELKSHHSLSKRSCSDLWYAWSLGTRLLV